MVRPGLRPGRRLGLFDEDSITRRVNRGNILLLGGGRALLMQIAHPQVAAGVDEHSDFRTHPIRRLRRTIRMTMAIVFGDRETALGAARAVNHVHANVRGQDYRALDPDLLLWVHATLADTALVTYETFVQRLVPREREQFYVEFKLLGELLGIPHDRFPETYADFEAYLDRMISADGPVRVDGRARELAANIQRPPVRMLPSLAMLPLNVVTTGLLPPSLREQYRLPWGPGQKRAFRLAVALLPKLIAITPPLIRVWPRPGRSVVLTASGRATTS
ncbi:MAG: hypothetical protein PVS3B2_17310 [Candidatus Dormibacteraceae bacterium]